MVSFPSFSNPLSTFWSFISMNAIITSIRHLLNILGIRKIPFPFFLARLPFVKSALIRLDIFQGTLESRNIVTYDDKIKCRGPLYNQRILFSQEGNDRIGELISHNQPLMISRLGSGELACLQFYLQKRANGKKAYPQIISSGMANPAGFFPVDDDPLDDFSRLYLKELKHVDILGVWFNHFEDVICKNYCNDAELVELGSLEPFHFTNPWSSRLEGRKVLVIHPFSDSIRKQYKEKRTLLFTDPGVLPEFELKTLQAVQSIDGSQVEYATWFDAYHYMCDEIAKIDFDICIIGAGAYGLPLASFAKKIGKQAIHMGGATQLLFGIKGRRWEQAYEGYSQKLFNEHWVRPTESETPANKDRIENGCYW